MNREELLKKLEENEIAPEIAENDTNTLGYREAMQAAVAKIQEKRTPTGKVWGVKNKEKGKPKLTVSQRLFVQGIMEGKTKIQAYRDAYNVKTANDSVVAVNANRLMKNGKVSTLLCSFDESLKEKILDDAVRTRKFIMEQLHEKAINSKTESSQLKALELMGKAVGMFTDRVEQTVENISTQKLKEELKTHLELLDNVVPFAKENPAE